MTLPYRSAQVRFSDFAWRPKRRAYQEFELQVQSASARSAKSDLVRRTVLEQAGHFTLAELVTLLPSSSPQLIKKVLAELKGAKKVRLLGKGRGLVGWSKR